MEFLVSENVYADNAMNRRMMYQYGALLPASPHGYVGQGVDEVSRAKSGVEDAPLAAALAGTASLRQAGIAVAQPVGRGDAAIFACASQGNGKAYCEDS